MRIIKPYGRSRVEYVEAGEKRRVLTLRPDHDKSYDIVTFAETHDELVIAQWVSTIDKIAAKPGPRKGATDEQRNFRDRIGKAAWAHLVRNALLPSLADADHADRLAKIWKMKIAPYGDLQYRARKPGEKPPSAKGRWYGAFAGETEVADADAGHIVAKIHQHLYNAEVRINGDGRKRKGRIAARAESIAGNVLRPADPPAGGQPGWSGRDLQAYRVADIANQIWVAAEMREQGKDGAGTRRVTNSVAGKVLFEHWARIFPGPDGKALSIREAAEKEPGLFALHTAVKDCYARILKHHKKKIPSIRDRENGQESPIRKVLPRTMDELLARIDSGRANRDLNALVRLGKIIHYTASDPNADHPASVTDNWPGDLADSHYWTSAGQAEIKRNEAFVRVWRHVVALAARTLTDWGDPEGAIEGDILLKAREAVGDTFDEAAFDRKCAVLLGKRAVHFTASPDPAFKKAVLKTAIEGMAALRHKSFHFAGRGGFIDALEGLGGLTGFDRSPEVKQALRALLVEDIEDQSRHLRATMVGAHFGVYLSKGQVESIYRALTEVEPGMLPLPRLSRVLRRAENAFEAEKLLPSPVNRLDLEKPGRLCQYTGLKLLYERPFRGWLESRSAAELNAFVDRAVTRASDAARTLNTKESDDWRDIIVARAEKLGKIPDNGDIHSFFFGLSAETASEMRVQQAYESDGERARQQAGYIENLKCDVVGLAYRSFLESEGFDFLRTFDPQMPIPEARRFDPADLPDPAADTDTEDWQAVLYFLVHLVPVDEIGRLLHQMRKWDLLAHDRASPAADADQAKLVGKVQRVFTLYLDLHDAKFEGGEALTGIEPFRALFEEGDGFDTIFPPQQGHEDDRRVPLRGLREIMRFGDLPPLLSIYRRRPVAKTDIERYRSAEAAGAEGGSQIARLQAAREELHTKWAKSKKDGLGPEDRRAYVEALAEIVRHRHLSAHVTLTNHVRLHRLMMAVLGRLADFSGLWERDLYFATLALLHRAGKTPRDVFQDEGISLLRGGQIIFALRKLNDSPEASALRRGLFPHFASAFERGHPVGGIRNDFAHFNMLQRAAPPNLTECANQARRLMKHDRKLKNAVSKSIIDLLAREGLELSWKMHTRAGVHDLAESTVSSRQAQHLGQSRLYSVSRDGRDAKSFFIMEDLHGADFVEMVAELFGGSVLAGRRGRKCVSELHPDSVDWSKQREQKKHGAGKTPTRRARGSTRGHRNRRRQQ